MQAIEVRLQGSYWDSFLYDDRLYLATTDGMIIVVRWDALIDSLALNEKLKPLAVTFLTRGRAWYSPEVQQMLRSPPVRDLVRSLVAELTSTKIEISATAIRKHTVKVFDSPSHPHTDMEIYYNCLFASSSTGVHYARLSQGWRAYRFERIFDATSLRLAGGYKALGIAAGDDGLFEQPLNGIQEHMLEFDPMTVSGSYCQSCSWARFDLVGTSGDGGYIAAYSSDRDSDSHRELIEVISADRVFQKDHGLLFSASDQLVLAGKKSLIFGTWNPYRRREGYGVDLEKSHGANVEVEDRRLSQGVIDGTISVFGCVIELHDTLLILASDGTSRTLREPVNWRCFPRSERYINHLHVAYEHHLKILAYVHDYFLPSGLRGPATSRRFRAWRN